MHKQMEAGTENSWVVYSYCKQTDFSGMGKEALKHLLADQFPKVSRAAIEEGVEEYISMRRAI